MPEKTLPLVGAAISVKELPAYADWLLEDQRDLEIPDAAFTPMFDGDWSHTAIGKKDGSGDGPRFHRT